MASDSMMSFDGAALEDLGIDLQAAADLLAVETEKTLAVVGEAVADTAKEIVKRYSDSIPPTIHVIPAPDYVTVRAGSEDVPLAALYEKGNQGKGGTRIRMAAKTKTGKDITRSAFRHPVFGDMNVWVAQARHPFFRRALYANTEVINRLMAGTYDRALEPLELTGGE